MPHATNDGPAMTISSSVDNASTQLDTAETPINEGNRDEVLKFQGSSGKISSAMTMGLDGAPNGKLVGLLGKASVRKSADMHQTDSNNSSSTAAVRKPSMPSSLSRYLPNGTTSAAASRASSQDDKIVSNGASGASRQSTVSIDDAKTTMTTPTTLGEGVLTCSPVSTSPPAAQTSAFATADNAKDIQPSNVNQTRYSSPPTFSAGSSTATTPAQLVPPNPSSLRQRHTLQIPRVTRAATSPVATRSEQDILTSAGPTSAARDLASGRFSPTSPSAVYPRRASMSLVRRPTRSINSDRHFEELPQDEDQVKWVEAIRAKRASKRKRKEEEDEDRVLVGTKVDQNHVNFEIAYNMLTGIRFTVSRTNAKLDRDLDDADFTARHKFSFDVTGNELTPSAKYDFKFKDYAPWVFRHLRAHFGLDPADYLMSLTSRYILSELGSPGKSGSFFYFSRDYKYIIKTIHHGEHLFLRKILKEYYNHVTANPNTLISQFYGLHRVKIPYGRKIHFVVMNNLFPPHRDMHVNFDLKGSTIGRDYKEELVAEHPRAVLKDLNWLRRHMHLELGHEKRDEFLAQMETDVHLLQRLKIMDYSLLIGIHNIKRGNRDNIREKQLKVFQPGGARIDGLDLPPHAHTVGPGAMGTDMGAGSVSSLGTGVGPNMLVRTPSKLETARKARELRKIIKTEKPIQIGPADFMEEIPHDESNRRGIFYRDDGGLRATHEDGSAAEFIYYLGIIDCLTRYNFVKKMEHFFKGFKYPKNQISAVAPEYYGERFVNFISGSTMSPEQAGDEEVEPAEGRPSEATVIRRTSNASATVPPAPVGRVSTTSIGGLAMPIPERDEEIGPPPKLERVHTSRRETTDSQGRTSAERQLLKNQRQQEKIDARKGTSPPISTAWDKQRLEDGKSPMAAGLPGMMALSAIKGLAPLGAHTAATEKPAASSPTSTMFDDDHRDRIMSAVRTPSVSGQAGGGGTILPVVKESSSETIPTPDMSATKPESEDFSRDGELSLVPPPTPPKDKPSRESLRPSPSNEKLSSSRPISRSRSASRDKPLPAIPPLTNSPEAEPPLPMQPSSLAPKVKTPNVDRRDTRSFPIKVHQPPVLFDNGESLAEVVKLEKARGRSSDIIGRVQKVKTP